MQAQSAKEILEALESVDSIDQVYNFKANHSDWDIEMVPIYQSDTAVLNKITPLTPGTTMVINQGKEVVVTKAIKQPVIEAYRFRYIEIFQKMLSDAQVDSLKEVIIRQYKRGDSFGKLGFKYQTHIIIYPTSPTVVWAGFQQKCC